MADSLGSELEYLGTGEREALALAEQLHSDAILIDDKDARVEAARRKLKVIGTLAVLVDAAEQGLLDLPEAVHRLRQTSFRASPQLFDALLKRLNKDSSLISPDDKGSNSE